jgi:hypothetical protein
LITLLVLVVLASIAVNWVAHRLRRFVRQQDAVEAILNTGGGVRFDFEIDQSGKPLPEASFPGPAWQRHWVGDDLAGNVVEAEVQTDAALEGVKELPLLRRLHLFSRGITDAGLELLEKLPQIEVLYIEKTQVTEQGVRRLQKALPNCRIVR